MKLQVTLFDKNKKYKPMSTIVEIESMEYYEQNKGEVQKRALLNIAHQRRTLPQEIMKQGFTQIKVREYNIEKIKEQQEYKHRLNLIKKIAREREEKKTSKEWATAHSMKGVDNNEKNKEHYNNNSIVSMDNSLH